ncbi:MAG: alpha-isopropylmalate synthase regulatory domain-containing protein, partial [Anaerovoracaceae bacterium]
FKNVADKKKSVYDQDIEAIIAKRLDEVPVAYELERFVINSGNSITSTAVITLVRDGKSYEKVARGEGPIYASFQAIDKIVGKRMHLEDYQLRSITEGEDALGDAFVKLEADGQKYSGRGLSHDVIEASILAYINAVNKMIYEASLAEETAD